MNRQFQPRAPLTPVHKTRRPCPVCGKRDNCAVSGAGVYCRRVRSEKQGRDGGWWHPHDEAQSQRRPPLQLVKPRPSRPPVDRHTRDLIYRALLRSLHLLPVHRDGLLERGLSPEAIERGLFKSTPTEEESAEIVKELAQDCEPSGVAGFYFKQYWRMVKVPSGFFVPVLDRHGLVQGLQVRRDYLRHAKDTRYAWLSSKDYPQGTSSGTPAHVQNPERTIETGRVIITEGSLKAFVAAQYLPPADGGLIALSGVNCFREGFGAHLKDAFPSLHSVAIAFDKDFANKREVRCQLLRLLRVLKTASLSVSVRTWDSPEKGLDDYLVAEARAKKEVAA